MEKKVGKWLKMTRQIVIDDISARYLMRESSCRYGPCFSFVLSMNSMSLLQDLWFVRQNRREQEQIKSTSHDMTKILFEG